jgi:glycosyltransferase involved in cell wall biosynthesis
MRVLFLATNPAVREASTRYRVSQYFDLLRRAGHEPELSTFFAPQRRTRARALFDGARRRAGDLAHVESYDVVVVHRELLPLSWNAPIYALRRRVPIVFDFDDAVFTASGRGWRQTLSFPASTRALVDASTTVLAGNEFLATWARESHDRVEVVPTVVDTDVYKPIAAANDVPVIGWVGSPSTAKYLDAVLPVLDDLARSFRFRVRIVGAGRAIRLSNVEVESPPWRANDEQELFQGIDIGLYPLANDRWAHGKCGFKAIQYMACGVASVVSPVGVVREIVRPEQDGLWASSTSAWRDAIGALLESAERRRDLGRSGRAHAVAAWSLAATAPSFIGALEHAVVQGKTGGSR